MAINTNQLEVTRWIATNSYHLSRFWCLLSIYINCLKIWGLLEAFMQLNPNYFYGHTCGCCNILTLSLHLYILGSELFLVFNSCFICLLNTLDMLSWLQYNCYSSSKCVFETIQRPQQCSISHFAPVPSSVFYLYPFLSKFLFFLIPNLIAYRLPEWSETFVEPKPLSALSCKGASIDDCSLYLLIHLGLEFLVTYMKISSAANAWSERNAVCFGRRPSAAELPARAISPLLQGW